MKLTDIPDYELETMNYDDIAYIILNEEKEKMKINELFKKVCDALKLPESVFEEKIADFFELLTTDKRFIMLEDGYWDLREHHNPKVVVDDEDEEETILDENDEEMMDELEEEEENEVSPLSIEEIDNVSMVKPKETTSVITNEEALEESDEISEEEQDDYEAEIEDELDELDDALMEGDEE